MAAENYFGNNMTATVTAPDGTTDIPVGSLKQVTITVEAEHVELTSADTILREDVAKRNLNVTVNVGVAAFDGDTLAQYWLAGGSTPATSPTDTNDVATFTIEGTITSQDGTTITATVDEVYFSSLPVMDAQEGQWVQYNLQGDGKTISLA